MKKISIIFLLLICFTFSGCVFPGRYESSADQFMDFTGNTGGKLKVDAGPIQGGVLNLYAPNLTTLNPLCSLNGFYKNYSYLLFDSMVIKDSDGYPLQGLAKSWEVSDNGLIWTFFVRDNVLWHDGKPLTAMDIEFTMKQIFDFMSKSDYKHTLCNIAAFTAMDSSTLRIFLKKPDAFLPEKLSFPVIPAHIQIECTDSSPVSDSFTGTGQYKIREIDEKRIILVLNDDWWGFSAQINRKRPQIKEIHIVFNKDDSMFNAWLEGETDFVFGSGVLDDRYKARSDSAIVKYNTPFYEFMAFNLKSIIMGNITVREAITQCIDRNRILYECRGDMGILADLPVLPGHWIYSDYEAFYNYSPANARDILSIDGWLMENGVRSKYIDNKKVFLELNLLVNNDNSQRIKAAEIIADNLKEAGIELNITVLPWNKYIESINKGNFDIAMAGIYVNEIDDFIQLYYGSSLSAFDLSGEKVYNISRYESNDVNQLIDMLLNMKDEQSKNQLFKTIAERVKEDIPYMGLYFQKNGMLVKKRIRGNISPVYWNVMNNIEDWYIVE